MFRESISSQDKLRYLNFIPDSSMGQGRNSRQALLRQR